MGFELRLLRDLQHWQVLDEQSIIGDCTNNLLESRPVADNEKDIQKSEKEEVKPIKGENESVELSEEDLENVAGGIEGGGDTN